jgi:2-polyprenyl-6-methoxyphenol hydroxylase-like FAD-dependent oxidoreductase
VSRVLVVGGGYVGMSAALGFERRLAARRDVVQLGSLHPCETFERAAEE